MSGGGATTTVPGINNFGDFLDKRLLVVLRDGRKLFGVLRSYDQFGNLTLEDTIERLYVDLEYADDNLGVFLIRGENVVLDEEEFRMVGRRMGRFKRPLEQLLPAYRQWKRTEGQQRNRLLEMGLTDMADNDYY